ncbi:MAG: hypothetical protein E6R06_23710 [Mycobacterium sp.]|nr:MAG: hypothetical protein E6R06_23710 [Mycobacterium sp.]
MPGPTMSRQESRARAERVVLARAVLRKPWGDIMRSEGFKSVGAAQTTYKREMARRKLAPKPLAEMTAQEILERRDVATRIAVGQLLSASRAGDVTAVAAMLREIRHNDVETAKMLGLYEPAKVDVNVTTDATAIIDRMESELLAVLSQRPPQHQLTTAAPILEAEVIE